MQIITGQAVRKENFWEREEELKNIWYKIETGQHILLVAPRRVGKTSIMYNILDNKKDNYSALYIDVENCYSENEFWRELFKKLYDELSIDIKTRFSLWWKEKIKPVNFTEIGKSLKLGENYQVDYLELFYEIIQNLKTNQKIIIMIDEFAQVVLNIIGKSNINDATKLLTANRVLRQNKKISEKVVFVYAGSIGLENVVSKIEQSATINDLTNINVKPLLFDDAIKFVEKITKSNNINIQKEVIVYLLKKIEWLMPFYIQLIIDKFKNLDTEITKDIIDKSFESLITEKGNFEHWLERLKKQLKIAEEFKHSKEILCFISKNDKISTNEINDIADKNKLSDENRRYILKSLISEGYINYDESLKEYKFNSPLLKMWWYKNVAN